MSSYNCSHCNRKYKLKENYDKHYITCHYLHTLKMQTQDEMMETMDTVPSPRELFQLIKIVLHKNSMLENELKQLKNLVNIRHKKDVLEWLKQSRSDQPETFTEWYQSASIEEEDLKLALNTDLTRAMEQIFLRAMEPEIDRINDATPGLASLLGSKSLGEEAESFKKKSAPPICWFKEKPQQLFIYETLGPMDPPVKKTWKLASHTDIEKMVVFWSRTLLKKFVKWQNENRAFFIENDKNKDLEILYMSRISGIKNPVEKRTADMKKWLYGFSAISCE